MSPVHLRNLGIPMNQPEDREGLEQDTLDTVMDGKTLRFNPASHLEELGASFQKICLKELPFKDLMVITKGWNPTRKLRLLEGRETRIRDNQVTVQAIEEQLNKTGTTLIPSGSQGVDQPNSPVALKHSATKRSVAKSHHYSQYQVGVTTTNNHPPERVLRQFQPEPKLWSIGHMIFLWPDVPFWCSMASCP
ncbi:hypothetical protein O181_022533 [Austropuccinia psidii MF-1]|uniref:Uncharacterized protein n=1 Tax=Austropuccinia psidii MF-1 TaxID=1389203 RepID=A0A9Q3CH22_9BASI|nr:hypothetical protein [Austropuccinia psidii MF-1]